jgi:putative ABC transport system permease protein
VRRATLRGLAARKLRVALTSVAVILGVALVAGTYVLTDTINHSFDDIFTEATRGTDVVVSSREPVENQEGGDPPGFPASVFERVERTPGVEKAQGAVMGMATAFEDGDRLGTPGAPTFVGSTEEEPFNPFDYVEGEAPTGPGQVAIDQGAAERYDIGVGDAVEIAGQAPARDFRVVGVTKFGEVQSLGGAIQFQMTLPEAREVTGKEGEFDRISVQAASGTEPDALARELQRELPGVRVETGQQSADRQTDDIADDLGFLQTTLLVFGWVAVFVGAFIIFNTFSITVTQRTREFAILRTIGASRRQVLGSVILEALLIGAISALVGLGLGILLAPALNGLLEAIGIDLPSSGTVIEARTVVVALLIGVLVTLFAALVPAFRATRVPPVAALHEGAVLPVRRRRRLLTPVAVAFVVAGVAMMAVGLFADLDSTGTLSLLAGGAVVVLLAVALLSPRLVRPIASLVGRPLARVRGVTGQIARENTMRNPGRTAVTAAALMIGLALVTFVTVFAAGVRAGVDDLLDRQFQGDFAIQNEDGFSPFSGRTAEAVARVPGVEEVSALRFSESKVEGAGATTSVVGVDPASLSRVMDLDWDEGSEATLRRLGPGTAVADTPWAEDRGLEVGDTFRATTPTGKRVTVRLIGTYDDQGTLGGDYLVDNETLAADYGERMDSIELVRIDPGANAGAVQREIAALLERSFPTAEVLDRQGYKDRIAEQLNQVLMLFYALLALSIIVSLFGIVNTLALSIFERTREIGLLRAVGTSRRQMRQVVRYESVITALIGAVLGLVVGVLFAFVVIAGLQDEGIAFAFPVVPLIALVIAAALAGVLAAILPARRATRVDVLDALAYE